MQFATKIPNVMKSWYVLYWYGVSRIDWLVTYKSYTYLISDPRMCLGPDSA
jgi:hypothetical protein